MSKIRKQSSSKKPMIIGGIVAALLLVVCVTLIIVLSAGVRIKSGGNDTEQREASNLDKEQPKNIVSRILQPVNNSPFILVDASHQRDKWEVGLRYTGNGKFAVNKVELDGNRQALGFMQVQKWEDYTWGGGREGIKYGSNWGGNFIIIVSSEKISKIVIHSNQDRLSYKMKDIDWRR